ncbi:putative bifunctional diguanylate cyclase/phosphodiesterase [Parasphingorhabdus sp.]|uniref:putative bifunctional diguanylate cyclase/phosphodiesterase n=1 Tax=Parasphingorhabdus sp. TaxID=2709688 RepID=UPI003002AF16
MSAAQFPWNIARRFLRLRMFRFGSLSIRIAALYAALFVLTFASFIFIATRGIENYAEQVVASEMQSNANAFDRILDLQSKQMASGSAILAADFGFRESVALGDVPTIESALVSLRQRMDVPTAFVLTLEGRVIGLKKRISEEKLNELWLAVESGETKGLMQIDRQYYGAVAAPIEAPDVIGWLVIGQPLDRAEMASLTNLAPTGLSARIVRSDSLPARWEARASAGKGLIEVMEKDERILYRLSELSALSGEAKPVLILRQSLTNALGAYSPIFWLLITLGIVGLAVVVSVGWAVARNITRPLGKLDRAAQQIGAGERSKVQVESDDEIGRLAGTFNRMVDAITEREDRISHIALHDALTGLPNRKFYREEVDVALKRCTPDQILAIFYIDLDNFKSVNDSLGHPIGDELLRDATSRMTETLGHHQLARLGGDEFGVLIRDVATVDAVAGIADRLEKCFARSFHIDGHVLPTSISIGIAVAPQDGMTSEELMKNADLALYRAKQEGKGRYHFFEKGMDEQARKRRQVEIDLKLAIEHGQFELHYQPLFNIDKNEINGFEALLRWNHPERGQVSPLDFIPLAEETGLIVQIGEWVIKEACHQAKAWPEHIRIAVNVSPVQFRTNGLSSIILQALSQSGLEPNRLEIEITESLLIENVDSTLAMLHNLRAIGVRIALDDFGTGYSSLSYLRSFPFDKIKIDRSFVIDILTNKGSTAIIRAITGLAAAFGMDTIAEGVEDQGQVEALLENGCENIQGFLLSRPLPISDIPDLIARLSGQDKQILLL